MKIINAGPILTQDMRSQLRHCFIAEEIKQALWSIADNKAPRIDGFNSKFSKAVWPIVGEDVVQTIQSFFHTGKMLKS